MGGLSALLSWRRSLLVRPNKPAKEPGSPRKKRKQSYARKSLPPNRVVCHAVDECPKCGRKLGDGWVKWRHQVVEIWLWHAEVTDHLMIERECGVCKRRCVRRFVEVEYVHGDETGWRENGVNGYLWSFSRLRLCATSRITTLEAGRL